MLTKEIYDIIFEKYIVEKNGDVFNKITGKKLKHHLTNSRYYMIEAQLSKTLRKKPLVHRLVAIKYIPNPMGLPQVNHKDGNRLNNHVSNLEWCTAKQNIRHSVISGRHVQGEKCGKSVLKSHQVIEIRMKYKQGKGTQYSLADDYGVSQRCISHIVLNHTWRHLL